MVRIYFSLKNTKYIRQEKQNTENAAKIFINQIKKNRHPDLTEVHVKQIEKPMVTILDRRKSERRWNYALFDSAYHQSHRLHIKHLRKYPSIRENER
jgi:hypothetical protein